MNISKLAQNQMSSCFLTICRPCQCILVASVNQSLIVSLNQSLIVTVNLSLVAESIPCCLCESIPYCFCAPERSALLYRNVSIYWFDTSLKNVTKEHQLLVEVSHHKHFVTKEIIFRFIDVKNMATWIMQTVIVTCDLVCIDYPGQALNQDCQHKGAHLVPSITQIFQVSFIVVCAKLALEHLVKTIYEILVKLYIAIFECIETVNNQAIIKLVMVSF